MTSPSECHMVICKHHNPRLAFWYSFNHGEYIAQTVRDIIKPALPTRLTEAQLGPACSHADMAE